MFASLWALFSLVKWVLAKPQTSLSRSWTFGRASVDLTSVFGSASFYPAGVGLSSVFGRTWTVWKELCISDLAWNGLVSQKEGFKGGLLVRKGLGRGLKENDLLGKETATMWTRCLRYRGHWWKSDRLNDRNFLGSKRDWELKQSIKSQIRHRPTCLSIICLSLQCWFCVWNVKTIVENGFSF